MAKETASTFDHPQELAPALMDRSVRLTVKQEIEEFEDKRKQCAANLKRISELLKGESLDEDEWTDIQLKRSGRKSA